MKRILLYSLFPLSVSFVRAQPHMSLTVDEALQVGLDKSKSLHSSWMNVQYADAKSGEANALRLPSLKFSGRYTRLSDIPPVEFALPANTFGPGLPPSNTIIPFSPSIVDNYNLQVTLQQPIFTGFRLERNADVAEYSAQATQKMFEKDRSDLVYNIKYSYWNLSKAVELEKVDSENVDEIRAHVRDIENWQNQGLATTNDVLKVKVQLSDAQLRLIDARNNVQIARISLNSVLGLPLETSVDLASSIHHEPVPTPELEMLVQAALEKRPEVLSMELRVKAGDAAVSLAQSNWWPQVYLIGDYLTARPNTRIFPTQDQFKDTWDVNLGVSFDLWNWGTTVHQTDEAKAQMTQAQDDLAQLRDAVTLDVTRSMLNLHRAQERIGVAEQEVRQAEENYRVTDAKFKQGLAVNTDLLDAEVALLQARTSYTESLVDYQLAEAALARSVGQ
ncbi:MAG TPA: TolC family protein [Bacteroidota bacterium]|nr:TolC family protein [Bacteroidota bacterium]